MDNGDILNNNVYFNETSTGGHCYSYPRWVSNVPQMPFMILQIQMVVVFVITQLLHRILFKRMGMPPLVSQLVAGLVVGPEGLGRHEAVHNFLFPIENFTVTKCVVMLAHTFSMFFIATQIDYTLTKRTGKKTAIIGTLSLGCALAANFVTLLVLSPSDKNKEDLWVATTNLPSVAHPSLVRLITDIGLANSELGRLTLASALWMDFANVMLTMIANNIIANLGNRTKLLGAIFNMLGIVGLLLVLVFILRPFLRLLIRMTPKDRPVKETYLLFAFLAMLAGAIFTDYMGQYVLLGAFMVGVVLPDGPPLGSALVDKFSSLISGVLYPFFVSLSAAKIEFDQINFHGELVYDIGVLIVVTFVTKFIVCFTFGVYSNMAHQDALSLAYLMCARGFLEIGTISWLRDAKIVSRECYSIIAFHVIVMSVLVPYAVRLLYDPMRKYGGYQIRDIRHLKQNATFRILACVLRSDNISSISNLLKVMNPTRQAPIAAYVLHLVKLAGRWQPLFISHDLQNKQTSYRSYSDELIWHFDRLQNVTKGVLSTHIFTALSHPHAMHEYICTLALDKVVSVIILPFHRKFGIGGSVSYDDHELRVLNTSVLARSPCSVAIFVERSKINLKRPDASPITVVTTKEEVSLSVAVIFIGGGDDREALAFAQRMNRGMRISLTVIRLTAPNDGEEFLNSLDSKVIHELLEAKFTEGAQQVMYIQIKVKDGIETALKVRQIAPDYDLVIVGRRFGLDSLQTSGLSESSEFKELGAVGDLLASPDIKCRTSALIVQQQRRWT